MDPVRGTARWRPKNCLVVPPVTRQGLGPRGGNCQLIEILIPVGLFRNVSTGLLGVSCEMILNLIDTDNRFRPRRDQQANGATDISSGAQRPCWLQRDDDINDFAVLLGRLDNRLEEGRHGCIIGGKMRGRMITGEPHDFCDAPDLRVAVGNRRRCRSVEVVVCSINLAVCRDTRRAGCVMNHIYFVKCVFQPVDVHVLDPSGFTDGCRNVLGR